MNSRIISEKKNINPQIKEKAGRLESHPRIITMLHEKDLQKTYLQFHFIIQLKKIQLLFYSLVFLESTIKMWIVKVNQTIRLSV